MILTLAMVFLLLPSAALAVGEVPEAEPVVTEPVVTEPEVTEPEVTEPKVTEPKVTEPKVTEPEVSEPEETEPQATQPAATEPAPDKKVKFTSPGKRNTETTSITAKFTYEFPEDSGLTEDDIGSMDVELWMSAEEDEYCDRKRVSAENSWTVTFDLKPGEDYSIRINSTFLEGYAYSLVDNPYINLDAGENETREYTVRYEAYSEEDPEEEAKLTVSLVFAADSELSSEQVGDITVIAKNIEFGGTETAVLTSANGRTAELTVDYGEHIISFSGLNQEGYAYSLAGNMEFEAPPENITRNFTVKYTAGESKATLSLGFAEDSVLQSADIGDITAKIYDDGNDLVGKLSLTQENGRTASLELESGEYSVRFSGYTQEGYFCDFDEYQSFSINPGENVARSYPIRYAKDEAKLKVSLDFAEDSAYMDADIGDIIITARNEATRQKYRAELTENGGRTAELTVPSGEYDISFSGHGKAGYDCEIDGETYFYLEAGDSIAEHYTLRYVEDAIKLTLTIDFAEDSALGDADIGEITATVYGPNEQSQTLSMTKENGRAAEITGPSGEYNVHFDGYKKEGYICTIEGETGFELENGDDIKETYTLRYAKNEAKLTVSLDFAEDSAFGDADIGTITAMIYATHPGIGRKQVGTLSLTRENGRTAEFIGPSGEYEILFSGYEKEGYLCGYEGVDKFKNFKYSYETNLVGGKETTENFTLKYVKDEGKLKLSLAFSDESELGDADVGDITAKIHDYHTGELAGTLTLTQENGRTAEITLPDGWYVLIYEDYEKDGHYCNLSHAADEIYVTAGEEKDYEKRAIYIRNEVKLAVSLGFAEDSALNDADLGDITAKIYKTTWDGYGKETVTLAETIVLSSENGRKGEITVPLYGYYTEDDGENDSELGWTSLCDYSLRLSGCEKEGYRHLLTGADDDLFLKPGEESGWDVTAKYAKEEHNVTVKVRLSEDSNVSAAELKEMTWLYLEETDDKIVSEYAAHSGSAVFTYTFAGLPASDHYRLNVRTTAPGEADQYDVSVQSITGIDDATLMDLEDGVLEFSLDGDREIEVILQAKQPEETITVVVRFAKNSALQAADFPQGISLTTRCIPLGPGAEPLYVGENTFSPDNNWTKTIELPDRFTSLLLSANPEGYIGTVTLSDGYDTLEFLFPTDNGATVYADVCFEERKPYYLDVAFVFAEDSALKGADAGSIFLDIDDSGTEKHFEFSEETGWHRTIEIQGNPDGMKDYDFYGMALSGLAREGYSYTLNYNYYNSDYLSWDGRNDDAGEPLWDRGQTKYLELEVRYAPEPGKLVVDIISSPYGIPGDTTVTVRDADGNVVAEKDTQGGQCVIELSEAGTYTVSHPVRKNTDLFMYISDGDKTVEFDPAKGATVTMLYEARMTANLEVRKYFGEDSELGPEDFEDGVTVTVTEATGAFSGTYTLSDANGWGVNLRVPGGAYTATETNADVEGYERTTRFVFAQAHYGEGDATGREEYPWDPIVDREIPEDAASGDVAMSYALPSRKAAAASNSGAARQDSTSIDTAGGPYNVVGSRLGNTNKISVYNTYTTEPPADDPAPTGSITITAGDGFYDFDSGDELTEKPDTGSEAESYTYKVTVDGEEQTVTLKPGETFELDGLEEGTQYSITPILPADYVWNTDITPITGTIGGEAEDDWNVEVSFENDYYYVYEDGILTIVKTDALTDETLKGAKFGLYADKDCTEQVATATTDKDGICSFTLTEEGTYYLKELKAPEDYYVKSEEVKTVTVETKWVLETREGTKVLVQKLSASVAGLPQKDGGYVWENERKTTDISVTKIFAHDEDLDRPESVEIVLYQDGEAYETVKLSADNNWTYVWKDMPLGFKYAVDELNVAKGYYKQIRSSGYDFTVVNSGAWIPQTGDESQIMFWCAGAMLSLCAIAFIADKKRRQRT